MHAIPEDNSALLQVLYFVEPIDEVAMQNVGEFAGKKLIDVSREGVDLGSDAEEAKKVSRQLSEGWQCNSVGAPNSEGARTNHLEPRWLCCTCTQWRWLRAWSP